MACKKFNKADRKLLLGFVSKMPTIMIGTKELHIMTGAEIIEQGLQETMKLKEGEVLKPNLKYLVPFPVQIAANHYRRLKKAWKKDGEKWLSNYFNSVKSVIDNNKS